MKKVISILLVLAFSFALVGCGSKPAATEAPAAAAEAPAAAAVVENVEAVVNESREDYDTVVIALQGELTTLDHQYASDDGNMRPITWNIYEPLIRLNGETLEAEGVLAESWTNVDDHTWEFKLRQGVKFHNGNDFNADDVVYSVTRVLSTELNSQLMSSIDTWDHAEKVDDYTVRIITKQPDPIMEKRVAMVPMFDAEYTQGIIDAEGQNGLTDVANGTGPYQFVEWKTGDFAAITAFEGYWGEAPAIKNAKFRFLEERLTSLNALEAGEIDLAVNMYPEYVPELPKAVSQQSNECYWVRFNQINDRIFKNLDARLAAAYGVQTEAIATALFQGYATPAAGQMGRPGFVGYSESVKAYGYDYAKASEYLAASGYAGEEVEFVSERGRWLKDGEVTEAVAADLQALGFNVATKFLAWQEWLDMLFDKERVPDLFFSSNGNDFYDMDRPFSVICSSRGNQSATLPSEWDDKIAAAQSEMDPVARQAMYDELNQHYFDDPYAIYLLGADALYGAAVDLDWTARRDTQILVAEMSYAK